MIYKYKVPVGSSTELTVPVGARILHYGTQNNMLCLWMLVNTGAKKQESRKFITVGTGNPITPEALKGLEYIGTTQMVGMLDESPVWHLFEVVR